MQHDSAVDTVAQFNANARKQAAHVRIVAVVAADNPDHAQGVHEQGQGVKDAGEWTAADAAEVALQC